MADNIGTPYADEYKRRYEAYWKTHQKPSLKRGIDKTNAPTKPSSIKLPNHEVELPKVKLNKLEKNKSLITIMLFFVLISGIFIFVEFITKNSFIAFISFILVILVVFAIMVITQSSYYKNLYHTKPSNILFIGYCLLAINIALQQRFYSVEWAFLGVIFVTMIFYDFKIDSRFLILPAILLLGYVPFLLIGKQSAFAELIAIYVYYFLVVGVVLQIIESVKETGNRLDFEWSMKEILRKINWNSVLMILGVITIAIVILNRFYSLEIWKWTSVYIFFVTLIAYTISSIENKL